MDTYDNTLPITDPRDHDWLCERHWLRPWLRCHCIARMHALAIRAGKGPQTEEPHSSHS